MIDITVDNNEVHVENTIYYSSNNRDALATMLEDVIRRVLYSGESVSLWIAHGETKDLVNEWVNPHVSDRYKDWKKITKREKND